MPRSLTTVISPYITDENYVSVYKNVTPQYESSDIDIELFVPYSALDGAGLQDGDTIIRYFASMYNRNDNSLVARSPALWFKYTK